MESDQGRVKVGLVELPDTASEVFQHFTKTDEWEAELVIVNKTGTYAERMARILGVPVHEFPHRELLAQCDLIIIGSPSSSHYAPIKEMMAGTRAEVVLLDEVKQALIERAAAAETAAHNPPASEAPPADEIDFVLDKLISGESDPQPTGHSTPGHDDRISVVGASEPEEAIESRPEPDLEPVIEEPVAQEEDSWSVEEIDPVLEEESDTDLPGMALEPETFEEEDSTAIYELDEETPSMIETGPEAAPDRIYDLDETLESESESEWAPESTPESAEGSESEPEPESDTERIYFIEPEPEFEPELAQDDEPESEPETVYEIEPETEVFYAPESTYEPEAETDPAPVSEPEPVMETDSIPTYPVFRPEPVGALVEEVIPEPEPVARHDDGILRYDIAALLSDDLARKIGPAPMDRDNASLDALLEELRDVTGANSVSLMLLEAGEDHLRIVAARGLSEEVVLTTRCRIGDGLAGTAYSEGTAQTSQAEVPHLAEHRGATRYTLSASVPIEREGHAAGVLSLNVESGEYVSQDSIIQTLTDYAVRAQIPILQAIDLSGLPLEIKREALTRHLDRIMAQEVPFNDRIRSVGEVLRSAVGADYVHFLMIDPANRWLEPVTEIRGLVSTSGRNPSLTKGLLAWVLNEGEARLLTFEDGPRLRGMAVLPIHTTQPYGVLVLENFALAAGEKDAIFELLGETIHQLEDIFQVEQSVETQDLVSQIRLRLNERTNQLDILPPALRVQPALEFLLDELGAEAAMWVPGPGEMPVAAQPKTREAARLLADAWDLVDGYCAYIREQDRVAYGRSGAGWTQDGPEGAAPYAGVKQENGNGVVILFFPPAAKDTPALPAAILYGALENVCEVIGESAPAPQVRAADPAGSSRVLSPTELQDRIQVETDRRMRSGSPFTTLRFELRDAGPDVREALRYYLLNSKRSVDGLGELEDGSLVLVAPDTDPNQSGIEERYRAGWRAQGRGGHLEISLHAMPGTLGRETADAPVNAERRTA